MENWTKKGRCPEEIWCCSFLVWEISFRKGFWVVNTWQAPEQKRLKSTFSCASSFLTKVCPRFLTITYVFFIAILWRILKSDFENQKHNQRQIIKKKLEEEKRGHAFVWVLVRCISVGKYTRKQGTYKVEKIHFFPTLSLIFPIFGESEKCKLNIFKEVILCTFKIS